MWVIFENERFNSVSHIGKEGSILRVKLKKRVQCFESYSILWVKLKKKTSVLNSVSRIEKGKVQFSESYLQSSILLSHIFKKKKINTLSHFRKSSILWVIFEKSDVQFFASLKKRFNSLWHVQKEGSILRVWFNF